MNMLAKKKNDHSKCFKRNDLKNDAFICIWIVHSHTLAPAYWRTK